MDIPLISHEELLDKLDGDDDLLLVETLEPESYAEAHLPGAINVPTTRIREVAPRLLPDKDAEIVVYCGGPA